MATILDTVRYYSRLAYRQIQFMGIYRDILKTMGEVPYELFHTSVSTDNDIGMSLEGKDGTCSMDNVHATLATALLHKPAVDAQIGQTITEVVPQLFKLLSIFQQMAEDCHESELRGRWIYVLNDELVVRTDEYFANQCSGSCPRLSRCTGNDME
ncbi:hypothetical protein MN608_11069 [Microdochium nivale]|nr:hypothetical protein MN608_11069 [Microdochium nivale]